MERKISLAIKTLKKSFYNPISQFDNKYLSVIEIMKGCQINVLFSSREEYQTFHEELRYQFLIQFNIYTEKVFGLTHFFTKFWNCFYFIPASKNIKRDEISGIQLPEKFYPNKRWR